MTRINRKKAKPGASVKPSVGGAASHFEIEVKVCLKNKQEYKRVKDWLCGQGYALERESLIVDFVEPSRSVTSRIRLEKPLNGPQKMICYIGKKSHPIAGELEQFVRQETEPAVTATVAVETLMKAIEAQDGEPIPYYSKRRLYFSGQVGTYLASIAMDTPKGLLKKFSKRYLEVEIQLPLMSTHEEVAEVVAAINQFIERVLGEPRQPEISYRKMVKETWEKRGMSKKRVVKAK